MKQMPNVKNLKWVEAVAKLMDSKFKVPGTNLRFGLDPILGLFPFLGDVSTFAVSAALVLTMAKNGASKNVVIRMVVNIILDLIIGSIPIIGSIFDFGFKANNRNVRLLRSHYQEGKYEGSGSGFLATVVIILLLTLALVMYGLAEVVLFIYHYIQQQW